WSYFESHVYSSGELQSNPAFTFQVKNPLKAPFDTKWNNDAKWKYYDGYDPYFKSVTECKAAYGYPGVSAKVKVLAVSDGKSAESTATTITFTEDDDNIPPVQSPVLTNHDSWLDFDGHSFKFEGIVTEDEGHASTEASYYYMPYSSAWGDNLSVARAEQIASLPGGSATYTSSVWIDGGARYSLTLNIPLNGIPDGKYMFFAKVSDTYGNYSYITLGKADIGTFKNKLKVNWRMNQGKIQLVSTLPVETGEQNFDRNMINIQNFETSSGNWRDRYGRWNELQDCGTPILLDGKKVIRYETTTTPSNKIIKEVNQGNVLNCTEDELSLSSGWYRITMQSFNDSSYVHLGNGLGANKKHGRPYNENLYAEKSGYWDWEESKYDVFTDETVSNTAYIFVPSGDSYLDGIKSSFFPSTSTPRSNKCFIVNVISASRDLGTDPDEWERRGKLIKTHFYDPSDTIHYTQFNESVAADDMFNSSEKGLVYYVAVVHFADGSMAISKTYTMQGM
ncbi:MAG: hypothetical protein II547_04780, partial [Treponema sp.]|nr:hypothetical protein [Treponema sp.]